MMPQLLAATVGTICDIHPSDHDGRLGRRKVINAYSNETMPHVTMRLSGWATEDLLKMSYRQAVIIICCDGMCSVCFFLTSPHPLYLTLC